MKTTVGLSLNPCLDGDQHLCIAKADLPDLVQRYCHDIKKRYQHKPVCPESDWPPSLGAKYINLALIKQGRTHIDFKCGEVVQQQKDYVRGKYDKILQSKTEISLKHIFDPVFCEGGHQIPLKMLIDGAPGVGKTTLSRNVSQKWAIGELLQQYWLVVVLHLRESDISRAQRIDDFFYHDNQKVQDAVITFVKEKSGRGVVLIFDGFDELSLIERSKQSLFLDIIRGKFLTECSVVITSRPYASRPVQQLWSLVNRHIEILGFKDNQIQECIKQRITNKAKADELCSELKDRLDISSICQIPLNLSIVLYVYELDYTLPDTLTELYELFILHGLKRYIERTQDSCAAEAVQDLGDLPDSIKQYFDILSGLAFKGLKEDELVFLKSEVEQAFSLRSGALTSDVPVLDLMTSAKGYGTKGPCDYYCFLHLTIQEYLGAYWAVKHMDESEKLQFLKQNLKNDRFYMVLWFFAGISKLKIAGVCSIFDTDLWNYDNHVHICHLLYESDSKNHSYCNYVANHCVLNKNINIAGYLNARRVKRFERNDYSRFDCLMIAHFLAHSSCHWDSLTINWKSVRTFHKIFNELKSNHAVTSIEQVSVEFDNMSEIDTLGTTTNLLNEIPQFTNVRIQLMFESLPNGCTIQTIESSLKQIFLTTKVIKTISLEVVGSVRKSLIKILLDVLIEGVAHDSLVSNIELRTLLVEDFEYLISLLIKWNSRLKLTTLSASKNETSYCDEQERCNKFCSEFSTFLATNASLKQISMFLPFRVHRIVSYIDTIQVGLDQNSILEELIISNKFVFQRNKATSKFELVTGKKLLYPQAPICQPSYCTNLTTQSLRISSSLALKNKSVQVQSTLKQLSFSNSELLCYSIGTDMNPSAAKQTTTAGKYLNQFYGQPQLNPHVTIFSSSESACIGADVDCFQASPAKRPKVGNSSRESLCQTTVTQVHVQPLLNPQQPQPPMAAFSSSHLPTLTHSPLHPPLFFSQCATVSPQSVVQPSYCMAGSSSTDGGSLRNYQILPQGQSDHQYHQSRNNKPIWTYIMPHGLESINTLPSLRPTPLTVLQNQPYPIPYQQQSHVDPSFNYYCQSYPRLHAGMNQPHSMFPQYPFIPPQTFMMPPRLPLPAGHPMQHFTSEPEQYRSATAPPQTIYYPNTRIPSTSVGHSPPLPTTSTST